MTNYATGNSRIAAFKPTNLIALLGFPTSSYSSACTKKIIGSPNSRKLIFYRFKLIDKIPNILPVMKQHKMYADYLIDVKLTTANALVVTLTCNKLNILQISPRTTKPYNKPEFDKLRLVVKNLIGSYYRYRSVPTDDGYEFLFFGVKKPSICDLVVTNLEHRYPNFTIRGEVGAVGLYLFITRKDVKPLPYGLKELLPMEDIKQNTRESSSEDISLNLQLINAIYSLITSGTSIKTIKHELDCSDAEMIELLDIDSTELSYKNIKKIGKLSNTTFTI